MAMIVALIVCFSLAADGNAQSLPGRPMLVVADIINTAGPSRFAWSYTYDLNGNVLTQVERESSPLSDVVFTTSVAFTYDTNDRVTERVEEFTDSRYGLWARYTSQWSYDAHGRPIGIFRLMEAFGEDRAAVQVTFLAYDSSGQLLQEVFVDGYSNEVKRTVYTYKADRVATRLTLYSYSGTEFLPDNSTVYEYDNQGRPIRHNDYFFDNGQGVPSRAMQTDITYDAEGRAAEELTAYDVDLNGVADVLSKTVRTYNASGDLVEELRVRDGNPDTDIRNWLSYEADAFTYDAERRLIKRQSTSISTWSASQWTYTYFY